MSDKNRPFVVWGSCFLWLASLLAIAWAVLLFLLTLVQKYWFVGLRLRVCEGVTFPYGTSVILGLGDMLMLTDTDIINSFVLLLGILLLPVNVQMLYYIAKGRKLKYDTKVLKCCPLWMSKVWIVIVCVIGGILCVLRLRSTGRTVAWALGTSLQEYRTVPKFKRFIDNMQWSLQCCGLNSYKDWFEHDWYDKSSDYEWEPSEKKRSAMSFMKTDSVPLSCCKSGSCISNYLSELGTRSINTNGCKAIVCKIIQLHVTIELGLFVLVILLELCMLKILLQESMSQSKPACSPRPECTAYVQRIMSVNEKFDASSDSYQANEDDM